MNAAVNHRAQPSAADPVLDDLLAEFGNELHAADAVDMEAFIGAHPERAEALRRMLPAIQVLAHLGVSAGAANGSPFPSGPEVQNALGELGDYRLVREIGRGGMGVVYEAEQISLRRRVALKILPFAAALDAKQLQRFKNEAMAAGNLHHQNIVPVHAVGTERGVHYYAMQFIDGQTLAALISELRQLSGLDANKPAAPDQAGSIGAGQTLAPAVSTERSAKTPAFFRTAATLGVQAAEALEHAHQLGVIHRDIKPANLLVDGHGNLWITDFGLAHCQNQAGLTMTGDLLGTLRYMSPEQALAKRIIIDHRTDIYSLGATMYELLTLQPVFAGRDRHELLRQIAFDEPRSPRRLNKAMPPELETIVLKAMEKNPADRYATAKEVADDLQRFLKDEPIRAKRPSLLQRARKWRRRHKAVVWTSACAAALLLLLGVIGLIVSHRAIALQQAETKEVNARLNANLWLAMETLDQVYLNVGELLPHDPQRKKEYHELLERVLHLYEEFAKQPGTDPQVRVNLAYNHVKIGNLLVSGSERIKAAAHYRRALDLQTKVVADDPGVASHQDRLALTLFYLADLLAQAGQTAEAAEHYDRAFRIVENLVWDWPGEIAYPQCLAWNRATCLDPKFHDPVRAIQVGQEAAVGAWVAVGIAHYRAGDLQAAVAALEKADQSGLRPETTALFLAMAHWKLGEKEQARGWYDRAIQRKPPTSFPVRNEAFRTEAAALLGIDRDQEARDSARVPKKQ